MRPLLLLLLFPLAASAAAPPLAKKGEGLALKAEFEAAKDPLTTENAWVLDPSELNPHRQRWMLDRDVRLGGIEPVEVKKGVYAAHVGELRARTRLYVRELGPWFRAFTEFRCDAEPASWFATREGAQHAGKVASDAWEETLKSERVRLAVRLDHISAPSAEAAEIRAQELFDVWRREVDAEWKVSGLRKARMAEWRYYMEQAAQVGMCKDQHTAEAKERIRQLPPPPRWEDMMEPLIGPERRRLLARAPARRWSGLFTIKVGVDVGAHKLLGQFLVDSGSALSILSPTWLESQGAPPALLEIQGAPPQRVTWSGGSGVAHRGIVFSASIGGFSLPFSDFLLMETELFAPPEHLSTCCDGILGADFLRHFAVELDPGPPAEVRIYARDGYQLAPGTPWVEVATTVKGDPISSCIAAPKDGPEVVGVRWDTGSEMALDIHLPWEKTARASKGPWALRCGAQTIGDPIPVTYPEPEHEGESSPLSARLPGMNAGMALLGRGPMTVDLSHGRLWFKAAGLAAKVRMNQTGLELEFVESKKGDRELRVIKLKPGSTAAALVTKGLDKGSRVVEIDARAADELDIWEIEQRLAGAYGESVKLRWLTAKGQARAGEVRVR